MRNAVLTGICAMLIASSTLAYQVPGSDAPEGAEVYIVTFNEPGAAKYDGGVSGLRATAGMIGARHKNAAASTDVRAYRDHLDRSLDNYADQMSITLGRSVQPLLRYTVLSTGMALELTAAEAQQIAGMAGVIEVRKDVVYELDTDVGPQWIGADTLWDGSNVPGGEGNFGAGIIVGVLDTGINMDHASFSATPEDGHTYVNPFGDGVFIGACDATFVCNNKLIGVWDFVDAVSSENDGPEDGDGHGSHTASTAAGNFITGPFLNGGFAAPSMSGVARHANLITYDVCHDAGCPGSALNAGLNQALLDGVDVVNYSISGGGSPWSDADRTFLDLVGAGILVSASAGNSGPAPSTVAHLGPWTMTVANQTHNRQNKNNVSVVAGPPDLQDMWGQLGSEDNFGGMDLTAPTLWAGSIDPANFEGCNPWPMGTEFAGSIALISRGSCTFETKIVNAEAAGALGLIVFNHLSDIPFSMSGIESATIPSLMIGTSGGEALRDHIIAMAPAPVTVTMEAASQYIIDDSIGSWANSGSSRGPNLSFSVTKPDIGGPGTNVFAAFADVANPPFAFLTGTSMSSPHAAGAAALIRAIHPDWSPPEVKSALMMTAKTGFDEFGNPANPDIDGSGTVDLTEAARSGLVMHETFDNFLAANPSTGGDPATLNLASMRSNDCFENCSWVRTVCNALDVETSWTVTRAAPTGYDVRFSSAAGGPTLTSYQFTLGPAGSLLKGGFEDSGANGSCHSFRTSVDVFDPQLVSDAEFVFHDVDLAEDTAQSPPLKMTVSFLPTGTD